MKRLFSIVLTLIALSACTVLPSHETASVAALRIRDLDQSWNYLERIGPLAAPGERLLMTAPVQVFELPAAFVGWKQFDFNADGVVDDGEQTVAWLEKLFELRMGRKGDLLWPSGFTVEGVRLSTEESLRIRASLVTTLRGKSLVDETEAFLSNLRDYRRATTGIVLWPLAR